MPVLKTVFLFATMTSSLMASQLDLEVSEVREDHPSYREFCENWPGECELTGAKVVTYSDHREQYYAHALLLVETTAGTFVLDQDSEEVLLWDQAPYIYEARERVDGTWERFFQDW